MLLRITFAVLLIECYYCTLADKPIAHVLLVEGRCVAPYKSLTGYWIADIERKKASDAYPVDIVIEAIDYACNTSMYQEFLPTRAYNTSMPPLSLIVCFYTDCVAASAEIATDLGIPIVAGGGFFPSSRDIELPISMPTVFAILPPSTQYVTSAIDAYSEAGAKTIVTVAVIDPKHASTINEDICINGGREYARSRGFTILASFNFTRPGVTEQDILGLVRKIRDELNPDVLMWCDHASGGLNADFTKFNVLPVLKRENYLPKALLTVGMINVPTTAALRAEGLLLYVTAADVWSPRLKGRDYTQEDNPYCDYFRPNISIDSVVDNLNSGAIAGRPSSNELFVTWFNESYGFLPTAFFVHTWTQMDIAESALYRAAIYRDPLIASVRPYISGSEVMTMLRDFRMRGVLGVTSYNKYRINDAAPSITLQDLELSGVPHIVAPKSMQTSTLVYPMPSWDERVYEWKLIDYPVDRLALNIAIACAVVLFALAITAILYRGEAEVRMLDYRHIVLMCLASALACFGLALFWQGDASQSQCDAYLWVVVLPLSFVVQLSNMKAHRLSVFLRLNGKRSKRPFTHAKVMGYTLLWLLLTIAVLLAVVYADPPKATRFITDPLRPKFDHYECKTGSIGGGLLYGLFAVHFAVSIATTIAVRNGSEAFRDGTVIKESFFLFYICIVFAYLVDDLNVGNDQNYIIRTAFVAVGVTLLNFRLLFQRCVRHWIPESVRTFFTIYFLKPLKDYTEAFLPAGSASVTTAEGMLEGGIVYPIDIPADNKLDDLYKVFSDPGRLAIFYTITDKLHVSENVDFIAEVLRFKQLNADSLKESTVSASAAIRQRAQNMFEKYARIGADCEINISHALNRYLQSSLANWDDSAPFLSNEAAERGLDEDTLMRNKMFDAALKEVATMLYQNMWIKFVEKETELQMGADIDAQRPKIIRIMQVEEA